jgi:glycopeptide antibiotics resistance protein
VSALRGHPVRLAAAWSALILVVTMLPFPFVTVPGLAERKLAQFALNPLAMSPGAFISRRDVIVNVLLFVPFGIWTVRTLAGRMSVAGFTLSACAESIQFFAPGRFSTVADLLTNTTGSAIGAWVGVRRRSADGATP